MATTGGNGRSTFSSRICYNLSIFFSNITVIVLYTSEKRGNDETGVGTEDKPFKTILQVSTPHIRLVYYLYYYYDYRL